MELLLEFHLVQGAQQLVDPSRELFQRGASALKSDLEAEQLKPLENGFRSHLNSLPRMIPILFHVEQTPRGLSAAREAPELLIPKIKIMERASTAEEGKGTQQGKKIPLGIEFFPSLGGNNLFSTTSRGCFPQKSHTKTLGKRL